MSSRRTRRRLGQALFHALEHRLALAAHIVGGGSFATIQGAVDAATAGQTINVDAGTYPEGIFVNKSLTIRGARAGVDGRSNIRTDLAGESIVTGFFFSGSGTRSSSFAIQANNVTIDGFYCQDANNTSNFGAAIHINPNINGTKVKNCVIRNNIAGLHLSNNGASNQAIIQYNLFTANNTAGPHEGRAIYSDGTISGGTLQNVLIDSNQFTLNLGPSNIQSAIGFEALTGASIQTNVTISNNYFDVNGKAILAFNASDFTISSNVFAWSRDTKSAGLRFEGGCVDFTITGNTIHNSEARGIRLDRKAFAADNTGFTITGNNIFGNGLGTAEGVDHDGIYIDANTYTGTLDATNNWWGAANGPGGVGPGSGDKIWPNGETVNYSSWATTAFLPLQKPYSGAASDINYTIQAENFDHGNEPLAYADSNGNIYFYRPYEKPDLELTTDVDGIGNVTEMRLNEYLVYTVNVPQAASYTASLRVNTTQATGATYQFQTPNGSGGWTNIGPAHVVTNTAGAWQTQTRSGLEFQTPGVKLLRLLVSHPGTGSHGTKLNWFKFTFNTPIGLLAPTGLGATINAANINLSWTDTNTAETGHVIEKKIGAGAWAFLANVGANVASYSDTTGFAINTTYTYRVRATLGVTESPNSNEAAITTPPTAPVVYLSDLTWTAMTNGWGPVELDRAVGTSNAGDGPIITLNGVQYTKGLGTHAISEITYNLAGAYWAFSSDVGIDDATGGGTAGQVQFQVFVDSNPVPVYDSGSMTGVTATKSFSVNVAGVNTLRLKVLDLGNTTNDWADWANARLVANTAAVPTWYLGTGSNDQYQVRLDAGGLNRIEVLQGGSVIWSAPKTQFPFLKFNPGSGDDSLNADYTNGSPIPTGGVFYDGGTGTADTLIITGGSGNDSVTIANALAGPTSGNININDPANGAATVEGITFNGNVGNDSLTIQSAPAAGITFNGGTTVTDQDTLTLNAGSYTFNSNLGLTTANLALNVNNAGTTVDFVSTQKLASLAVNNALLTLSADGTRILNTGTVAIAGIGRVDLKDNDMIVRDGGVGSWNGTNYTGVTNLVKTGYNNGAWNGTGAIITSQTRATAFRDRTHLAIAEADDIMAFGGATALWQGQTVTSSSVLIKYTYIGDADLNGDMDGDDYSRIDQGFSSQLKGYVNGDYDFNGIINADDYFWLDNSYSSHGGLL